MFGCVKGRGPDVTFILWKVIHQMGMHDLLLQQIFLIEEENDGRVLEPGIRDDGPKQSFALLHTILSRNRQRRTQTGWKLDSISKYVIRI